MDAPFDQHSRYWLAKTKVPDFFLSAPPAKRALDLGSGGGRLLRFLASRCEEVYGIDNSEVLVEATRVASPNATIILGDFQAAETWKQLPKVDLIVSNTSFRKDYCPRLSLVISHCREKLANGCLMLRIQAAEDLAEILPADVRQSLFYSRAEIEAGLEGWRLQILETASTLNPLRQMLLVTAQ